MKCYAAFKCYPMDLLGMRYPFYGQVQFELEHMPHHNDVIEAARNAVRATYPETRTCPISISIMDWRMRCRHETELF